LQKSDEPFLKRRARGLIKQDLVDKFSKIEYGIYTDTHPWAVLKLIYLDYIAGIYATLISKRYKKYYYVDLFSGSGIGKISEIKNDLILGSPLLIGNRPNSNYTRMFFCERKRDIYKALNERLNAMNKDYVAYNEDCNTAIDKIINEIKNGHSLIFLDQFGMDIKWLNMDKILQLDADIIINFQTPSIARGIKQGDKTTNTAKEFFKDINAVESIYNKHSSENLGEQLFKLYLEDLKSARLKYRHNYHIIKIKVRGNRAFYYDLIYITKQTRKESPWLKPIIEAGQEIVNLDRKDVEEILDILKERQKVLFK
jgi:three-Cys-motif partner protein